MSAGQTNIHGTAITVNGTGLLFLGPSGSGKSALAFDCLAEARLSNLSHALIADDRVLVSLEEGRVFASAPETIRGLIELRYSGIVSFDHVANAELHYAVLPVQSDEAQRLPPYEEHFDLLDGVSLPVVRVPSWARFPLSLIFARLRHLNDKR